MSRNYFDHQGNEINVGAKARRVDNYGYFTDCRVIGFRCGAVRVEDEIAGKIYVSPINLYLYH